MTRTSPAQGAREASIVIMINMWKVFALLALLYIIPVHNPIHSLPWWAVTIPLWFVPFFKVVGWAVRRYVAKKVATLPRAEQV